MSVKSCCCANCTTIRVAMMFRLRKLSLPFSTGGPEENSELLVSVESLYCWANCIIVSMAMMMSSSEICFLICACGTGNSEFTVSSEFFFAPGYWEITK